MTVTRGFELTIGSHLQRGPLRLVLSGNDTTKKKKTKRKKKSQKKDPPNPEVPAWFATGTPMDQISHAYVWCAQILSDDQMLTARV